MKKKMKRALGVAAVVADVTLMATGCVSGVVDLDDDWTHLGKVEVSAPFSRTVEVNGQTSVKIAGLNGSIRVSAIPDAQNVTVNAIRTVRSDSRWDAQDHLSKLQVSVQLSSRQVDIKTIQPAFSGGRTSVVDNEIGVPSHFLANVTNGNGSIRLDGVRADVKVTNGNGGVALVDHMGSSWVSVGNGEISASTVLPEGGQIVHAVGNCTISLTVPTGVSATFGA